MNDLDSVLSSARFIFVFLVEEEKIQIPSLFASLLHKIYQININFYYYYERRVRGVQYALIHLVQVYLFESGKFTAQQKE